MLSVSCPWSLLSFRRLRREAFVQPEPIVVTGRAQFAALKMVSDAENSPSGPALSREIERQLVVVKVVALGVARIEDVVNENAGVKGFASAAAIPHFNICRRVGPLSRDAYSMATLLRKALRRKSYQDRAMQDMPVNSLGLYEEGL